MKYDYYYPDTAAEFDDYGNGCDPDPFYDYEDDDNPVDLIDDIKESDMNKKEIMINQELYELGFIGKKDFVVTELKDKIKIYEAEITKIFTELKLHLRDAKQKYDDRDYAPTDIINLSNYLNSLEWCLCMCRDRLVGISHDVHNDISDYAHK